MSGCRCWEDLRVRFHFASDSGEVLTRSVQLEGSCRYFAPGFPVPESALRSRNESSVSSVKGQSAVWMLWNE